MARRSRLLLFGLSLGVGLFGAFLGAVGTIYHRSAQPWGAVVGLLLIAGFGIGLRFLRPGRTLALIGFAALISMQLALSATPDGSLIVVAGPIGYLYTLGVVIIGAAVLSWPDLRSASRYDRNQLTASREDHP